MEIYIDYFFESIHKFPWGYMALDIPRVGPVHSYLCTILAKYDRDQQQYLYCRPSWKELNRYAEQNQGLAKRIRDYCRDLNDMSRSRRGSVATEVLKFLEKDPDFRKDMYVKLTRDYNLGRIVVPDGALRPRRPSQDY